MNINHKEYVLGGIKGKHCEDRIKNTLSSLPGITEVRLNSSAKKVSLDYDPNLIASGYIEETLQSLGYSIQG